MVRKITRKRGRGKGLKVRQVSDLERARFLQRVGFAAKHLVALEAAYRTMNDSVQFLDVFVTEDMDRLGRIGFSQDEIRGIRALVAGAKSAFSHDEVRAAINSTIHDFSLACTGYAKLVNALKTKTVVRSRVKKKN